MVASGVADVAISYLSLTLGRAKKVNFSDPYGFFSQSLILNQLAYAKLAVEGVEKPTFFETLNQPDALIAVTSGSSYLSWGLRLFPKATFDHITPEFKGLCTTCFVKGEVRECLRSGGP